MQRTTEQSVRNIVRRYLEALGDDQARVREDAARALGELRATETMEPLIGLLTDPIPKVQIAAADSLGRMGDPRALLALEQKAITRGAAHDVRAACSKAAAQIKSGDKAHLPRSAAAVELNTDTLPRAVTD